MNKCCKLLVKFKPDAIACVKEGRIYFSDPAWIINHANFIFDFNYTMAIPGLAKDGSIHCTENDIDFSQYKGLVYVETDMACEQLECLAGDYQQLCIVDYVVLEPAEPIQPPHVDCACPPHENLPYINALSTTPDLASYQLYLRDNPQANVYGIDADYAWSLGIAGQGVRCADVEWGINYQHEDLVGNNFINLLETINHESDDHGTAVAGIIMARKNDFGMLGGAYNLDTYYGVSELPLGRVAAIALGLEHLRPGDVFLFEMQTGGQNGQYVPPDYNMAVWDITKTATDAGIIVVMTAGNGAENLDDPFYYDYRLRGDNGAIRLGAGTKVGRNRVDFSTFGSTMVHVQGWGDWTVATTGYGTLFDGGANRNYTYNFSGTSSAGPIVASAVILIQSWYKAHNNGQILSPESMRSLLISTGTPQGTGGHIGPLPNVKRAINALQTTPQYPLWVATQAYVTGDRVSWNGNNWQANWWSRNVEPGTREPGGSYPWVILP